MNTRLLLNRLLNAIAGFVGSLLFLILMIGGAGELDRLGAYHVFGLPGDQAGWVFMLLSAGLMSIFGPVWGFATPQTADREHS